MTTNSDMPAAASFNMSGLTKREYFAIAAMQGACMRMTGHIVSSESLAVMAVDMADALLKELGE